MTARKPSAAVQHRAMARQAKAYLATAKGRWLCGGCGDTIRVECCGTETWIGHACAALGPHSGGEIVAEAVACPKPACDAVTVRCARCGGERAARAALAHHTCRAVTT